MKRGVLGCAGMPRAVLDKVLGHGWALPGGPLFPRGARRASRPEGGRSGSR